MSADIEALIALAAEVAGDLGELPVGPLEFTKSYGLHVHETVFWGQALIAAAATNANYGPGRPPELQAYEEELIARDLKFHCRMPTPTRC